MNNVMVGDCNKLQIFCMQILRNALRHVTSQQGAVEAEKLGAVDSDWAVINLWRAPGSVS